jgi:hypothetical protein
MSLNNKIESEHLLALLGQHVVYQQHHCEIIELLDGCEFVIQVLEQDTSIQATQYGEGHRNVPVTYILPIFDGEGDLHSESLAAGIDQLINKLRST